MAHNADKQASELINQTCHHIHQGNKSGDYQSDKTNLKRNQSENKKHLYIARDVTGEQNHTAENHNPVQRTEPIIVKQG